MELNKRELYKYAVAVFVDITQNTMNSELPYSHTCTCRKSNIHVTHFVLKN